MKQIGIVGTGILVGLIVSALTGCDAFDASHHEFASATETSQNEDAVPGGLAKAAYTATVYDFDGNAYILTYNYNESGFDADAGNTTFSYNLEIGNLSGFHFAIEIPGCAIVNGPVESVPAGTYNGNANGTLEFGPEDFDSNLETIQLTFPGEIDLGVVNASFKYENSGNTPEQVPILGPCQQPGEYWIAGKVFLDDPAGGDLNFQDAGEPGIAGVEVALFEVESDGSLTPNQGEPTQLTAADGSYAFHVLGPPVFDKDYRVEIRSSGGGLNAQLFDLDGFWRASDNSDPVVREVDLSSDVGGIGFWLDINKAIDVFENGTSITDMLPWRFWNVQVTGKGSQKYKPVVDPATMDSYLEAINSFNSDLTTQVFGGDIDLALAADILQNQSKNDAQEELRTLTLAALFNFAMGRGVCGPGSDLVDDPADPYPEVCSIGPDLESTRLIIEQALVEWIREAPPIVGKESGGSMGRVLDAMM